MNKKRVIVEACEYWVVKMFGNDSEMCTQSLREIYHDFTLLIAYLLEAILNIEYIIVEIVFDECESLSVQYSLNTVVIKSNV